MPIYAAASTTNEIRVASRPPRTYYAKRLLEHGPLTLGEFKTITGWLDGRSAESALKNLRVSGLARTVNGQWRLN